MLKKELLEQDRETMELLKNNKSFNNLEYNENKVNDKLLIETK